MTDPIREAFEKHFKNLLSFATLNGVYVDTGTHWRWVDWQAAWQQSRREALDAVLRGLRSEEQTQQMRAVIASVECIRAAAEEEGK